MDYDLNDNSSKVNSNPQTDNFSGTNNVNSVEINVNLEPLYFFVSFAGENRNIGGKISQETVKLLDPPGIVGREVFFDDKSIEVGKNFEWIYVTVKRYAFGIVLLDAFYLRKYAPLKELTAFFNSNTPILFILLKPRNYFLNEIALELQESDLNASEKSEFKEIVGFRKSVQPLLQSLLNSQTNSFPYWIADISNLTLDDKLIQSLASEARQNLCIYFRHQLDKLQTQVPIDSMVLNVSLIQKLIVLRKKLYRLKGDTKASILVDRIYEDPTFLKLISNQDWQEVQQKMFSIQSKISDLLGNGREAKLMIDVLQGRVSTSTIEEFFGAIDKNLDPQIKQSLLTLWTDHMQLQLTLSNLKPAQQMKEAYLTLIEIAEGDKLFDSQSNSNTRNNNNPTLIGRVIWCSDAIGKEIPFIQDVQKKTNQVENVTCNSVNDLKQLLQQDIPTIIIFVFSVNHDNPSNENGNLTQISNFLENIVFNVSSFPLFLVDPSKITLQNYKWIVNKKGVVVKADNEVYGFIWDALVLQNLRSIIYSFRENFNDNFWNSLLQSHNVELFLSAWQSTQDKLIQFEQSLQINYGTSPKRLVNFLEEVENLHKQFLEEINKYRKRIEETLVFFFSKIEKSLVELSMKMKEVGQSKISQESIERDYLEMEREHKFSLVVHYQFEEAQRRFTNISSIMYKLTS